ncbi:MAG: hypothetical protein M3342_19195 [Bacteroidota bacterium]|nr:hypothetical protein [Bacteroidota bacterium]
MKDLSKLFAVADLEEKSLIPDSTFPEKLVFEKGRVRTTTGDSSISVLIKPGKDFSRSKKGSPKIFALPFVKVEDNGVEPVR